MADIYQQKGFKSRSEYLEDLADQYGVDYDTVAALAHVMGPNEDFDGLVDALNNFPMEADMNMKLICALADVCLPDYWSGHHLPHVAVPVSRDTTIADLREAILDELRMGAVAGATPETTYENDTWLDAACEAVERYVQPNDPSVEYPFLDLDTSDDEDAESVYAYFVFHREDD